VLTEFPSATDAVRCAVKIQRQCAAHSMGVAAAGMGVAVADQIALRIGINVADVLYDDSDIAGGGVNLAARLETLAPPGGICISQVLREQIHEDLGVSYLDAGSRRVNRYWRSGFSPKPCRRIIALCAAAGKQACSGLMGAVQRVRISVRLRFFSGPVCAPLGGSGWGGGKKLLR
jgi:hypothetical protein